MVFGKNCENSRRQYGDTRPQNGLLTAAVSQPWLCQTKTNGSITGDNLHLNGSFSSIRAEFGDRYHSPRFILVTFTFRRLFYTNAVVAT